MHVLKTSTTFVSKAIEEVKEGLDDFARRESAHGGMTNKEYLMLCEQMGMEPDPSRLSKNLSDFPYIVQMSLRVYHKLPDLRVSLGMEGSIFGGKDYSMFKNVCDLYDIDDDFGRYVAMVVCEHIEANRIAKEQAALKKRKRKASK